MEFQLQQNKTDQDMIEATCEGSLYTFLAFIIHRDAIEDEKILTALEDGKIANVEMRLINE